MAGEEAAERTEGSGYWAFMKSWRPGNVVSWFVVAKVIESKCPECEVGDMVLGMAPLRKFNASPMTGFSKIAPGVAATTAMSVTGMTSMTAFCGAKFIGTPKSGELAVVSGAAGATGLMACQTFKALGCRVVGSVGSDDKVALLKGLGVEAYNYKKEPHLAGLKRLCPNGFDVAFDNVGGDCLEAMLEMINNKGRIVLCGAISQYDKPPEERYGIKNMFHAIAKNVRLQGFIMSEFSDAEKAEATATLSGWLQDGSVKDTSTVVEGFQNFTEALMGLFAGANTGKMLLREPVA
jgi:NADPH-dependent curcumin reductase CurA